MADAESIAALEAQLRADPDDRDTWLVYKDWLLAQGDPRGERIGDDKAQHARAELWFSGGRVTESRYGFAIGLVTNLDSVTPALTSREARLVSRLEIVPDEPREAALDALASLDLGGLVALTIRYGAVGADGVRALLAGSSLRALRTLDLRYGGIGDDGAIAIAGAEQLAGVRALALQRNAIGEAGARALATSPWLRLESLDLRYNPIGLAGARALAGSPAVAGLSRLLVDRADIGAAGALALAGSPHLPAITRAYWSA